MWQQDDELLLFMYDIVLHICIICTVCYSSSSANREEDETEGVSQGLNWKIKSERVQLGKVDIPGFSN